MAEEGRLIAVGDIHGCLNELEKLISKINPKAGDTLVYLGDYVDRGPNSKGVLDFLIDQQNKDEYTTVMLLGNHEDMMLQVMENTEAIQPFSAYDWFLNGYQSTLKSFGIDDTTVLHRTPPNELLSLKYLEFLRNLGLTYVTDKYFFVHAGIDPNIDLYSQHRDDLLWIRGEFLHHRQASSRIIVHGHTPSNDIYVDNFRIAVDCGCVYGGKLAAIDLTSGEKFGVEKGG